MSDNATWMQASRQPYHSYRYPFQGFYLIKAKTCLRWKTVSSGHSLTKAGGVSAFLWSKAERFFYIIFNVIAEEHRPSVFFSETVFLPMSVCESSERGKDVRYGFLSISLPYKEKYMPHIVKGWKHLHSDMGVLLGFWGSTTRKAEGLSHHEWSSLRFLSK